ncbi:hypothetical protein BH09PSE2_BH09PSE2_07670 [soil metagenome]
MNEDDDLNLDAHFDEAADHEAGGDDDLVKSLRDEIIALKDQVLRTAAAAENTKRRAEKESNDARAFAIQRFARDMLDAADNLSRALQAAPKGSDDPAVKNLVTGIEMTEKALQTAFERNGLKKLSPERGARFDPNYHQAMMEQPADGVAPGSVVMVMQDGYELFGRVVRPALVAVSPTASAAAPSANGYGGGDAAAGGAVDAKA